MAADADNAGRSDPNSAPMDAEDYPATVAGTSHGAGDAETELVPPATAAEPAHAWSREDPVTEALSRPWRSAWAIASIGLLCAVIVAFAIFGVVALVRANRGATQKSPIPPTHSGSAPAPVVGRPPAVSTFAAPAPPPNRPPQGNCPPACTQIPDSAWIASPAIPLYNDYSWAALAPLSEPVTSPRFEADELCAAGPAADDERASALAARIILPNPPGQWQLQVQILHWRGDPWIAGQRASAVMDSATSMLRNNCSFTSPGVSVSRIAEQNVPGHPRQSLTAVITEIGNTPRVVHEYLVSDLRNSTVVEVAMWSTSPPAVDWPTMNE
jgi:hypothetical protein